MTSTSASLPSHEPKRANAKYCMAAGLPLATMVLLSMVFPPIAAWFLTPVALAPLILAAQGKRAGIRYLLYIWLVSSIYYVVNLYWLSGITVAGYIALSIYCGFYLVVFFWLTHLAAKVTWLPIWVSAPMLFTSLEYIRGHLFTGFPWFTLGVAFANSPIILQCMSIFGAAGLTFLAVMTASIMADAARYFIGAAPRGHKRSLLAGVILVACIWLMVIIYGFWQFHHRPFRAGPRIAVLQQNIPQSIKSSNSITSQQRLFNSYYQLGLRAARKHPNLVVWPETMVPGFLNPSWLAQSPAWYVKGRGRRTLIMDQHFARRLTHFAKRFHTSVLVGASGVRFNKSGHVDRMQNIAVLFTPKRGEDHHYYAKRHLVPFGEYLPFKNSAPWLHHLLSYFTPFGPNGDYSLTPGDSWHHFVLDAGEKPYVFGVPICYEDAMATPARMFCQPHHGVKGADFLVVISNDGWYQSRPELLQHLQLDQVRAVENRISIARCVNGGYCGFINPSGRIIKLVSTDGHHAFVRGISVADIPIDTRITIFTRWGYLFSSWILGLTGLMLLGLGVSHLRLRRQSIGNVVSSTHSDGADAPN